MAAMARRHRRGSGMCNFCLHVRLAASVLLAVALQACGTYEGHYPQGVEKGEPNIPPQNWRADSLAFLRSWLNDPVGIRDAAIAEPELKSIGGTQRYVVCVRFNARKSGGGYEGVKDRQIVFLAGRLDTMIEARKDACATARYQPFPELEKLPR
jgi:hypothetical protein